MKVCLINVNNCINYSQYGPFFFENIRNNECIIYDGVTNIGELSGLYDFLVEEFNRNAFTSEKIRLVFLIARNMDDPSVKEREFFVKINIYKQILSKIDFYSSADVIFLDKTVENVKGEQYRFDEKICEYMLTTCEDCKDYLPCCDKTPTRKELKEKISNIKDKICKEFANEILASISEEVDESVPDQLKNIYASECAKRVDIINTVYELINPRDISDQITKTIEVIYFIKSLFINTDTPISELVDFKVDHDEIKVIIKTYKNRLEDWKKGVFDNPVADYVERQVYKCAALSEGFCNKLDTVIDKDLEYLEKIKNNFGKKLKSEDVKKYDASNQKNVDEFVSVVDETFEKLDKIVKHAKDEVTKFAEEEQEHFFDVNNNRTTERVAVESIKRIDVENDENDLAEKLNRYELFSPPGMTEIITLEQKLEKINDKIQLLIKCKKVYKMRLFIFAFLFAFVSVVGLYLGIQAGLIVAGKAYLIFAIYSAIVGVGFFLVYAFLMNFYKKQIALLLDKCREEIRAYLDVCKKMAIDFENNINAIGNYICYKDFVEKLNKMEKERDLVLTKYEWHKRKVETLLRNLNHFNDYIKGVQPVTGQEEIDLDDYTNDAEHTKFYQMKLFVKGK